MLTHAELGRGNRRRVPGRQGGTLSKGSTAVVPKKVGGEVDEKKTVTVERRVDGLVDCTNQVSVTFWTPDGAAHEGKTSGVGHAMLFVESKHSVPVGTDITIRQAESDDRRADWALAEGTVVWTCPKADDFKNREGFGLCIHGRWPQLPGVAEAGDSKGLA